MNSPQPKQRKASNLKPPAYDSVSNNSKKTNGARFAIGEGSSRSPSRGSGYGATQDAAAVVKKEKKKGKNQKLTFKQLMALTVSMGGSQVSFAFVGMFSATAVSIA
jgi:hypothetical protein